MYKLLINNTAMRAYTGENPQRINIGSLAGATLRLMNMTHYGLSLYLGEERVDYLTPYQYVLIPNSASYWIQLDAVPSANYIHPLENVTVKSLDERKEYDQGAMIQLTSQGPGDVLNVAGDVNIAGTPSVSIAGTPSVTLSGSVNQVSIANTPAVNIAGTPTVQLTGSGNSVNIANSPAVSISGTPSMNVSNTSLAVTNVPGQNLTVAGQVNIGNTPAVTVSGTVNTNITSGTVNATIQNASINTNSVVTNSATSPVNTAVQNYYGDGGDGALNPTSSVITSDAMTTNLNNWNLLSGPAPTVNANGFNFSGTSYLGWGFWGTYSLPICYHVTFTVASGASQGIGIAATGDPLNASRFTFDIGSNYILIRKVLMNRSYDGGSVQQSPIDVGLSFLNTTLSAGTVVTLLVNYDALTGAGYVRATSGSSITGTYLGGASFRDLSIYYNQISGAGAQRAFVYGSAGTQARNFFQRASGYEIVNSPNSPDVRRYTSVNIPPDVMVRYQNPANYTAWLVNGNVTINGGVCSAPGTPGVSGPPPVTILKQTITLLPGGNGGRGGYGTKTASGDPQSETAPIGYGVGTAGTYWCSGNGGGGGGGFIAQSGSTSTFYSSGGGGGGGGGTGGTGGNWSFMGDWGFDGGYGYTTANGGNVRQPSGGPWIGKGGSMGRPYGNATMALIVNGSITIGGSFIACGANGGAGGGGGGPVVGGQFGLGGGGGGGSGGGSVTLYAQLAITIPGEVNVNGGTGGVGGAHGNNTGAWASQTGANGSAGRVFYSFFNGTVSG